MSNYVCQPKRYHVIQSIWDDLECIIVQLVAMKNEMVTADASNQCCPFLEFK